MIFYLSLLFLAFLRSSESHFVASNDTSCSLRLPENFTQNHLFNELTAPCRYNIKHTPTNAKKCEPLKVTARIHVFHLKSDSEQNAEFRVQLLLQLHWKDARLRYRQYTNLPELVGERNFIQSIWTPHIYLTNERDSLVLGLYRRDMVISILPDGDVLFSTRLKTTIFCWLQLGKFPFDQQKCHLIMDSWRYNASELTLEWGPDPVSIPASRPYLTEYSLMDTVTQVQNQYEEPSAVADTNDSCKAYMYSSLTLTFVLNRQYGFYLMDFYAPSILLVCISWVSFWMAPDAVPGRTILGASTMLTFFQLGIETGSSLPNVSYIRSNDVWFFACTVFIFLSLAEFAFVNTIWRYGNQKVQLKKATSKYILKSSVHPHLQTRRRSLSLQTSPELKRFVEKLDDQSSSGNQKKLFNLDLAVPLRDLTKSEEDGSLRSRVIPHDNLDEIKATDYAEEECRREAIMTMQEIAIWVDNKCKIVFPLAFTLFNITYWGILYQS